jgi:hypothetical protein
MKVHELKCWPIYFEPLASGEKQFELRKNDRDFHVGDQLIIREYDPSLVSGYTGRLIFRIITYILNYRDFPEGLRMDYAILGLENVPVPEIKTTNGETEDRVIQFRNNDVPKFLKALNEFEKKSRNSRLIIE